MLRSLFRAADHAIYVKNLEGVYLLISDVGAQLLGKTAEEIVGHTDYELFPFEEARNTLAHDQHVLASGRTITYEEVQDGRVWLSTKGPLLDGQGRVVGLFGMSRDITESVRARQLNLPLLTLLRDEHEKRRSEAQPLDGLTPREREVLARISEGDDNLKIAAHLGITERTVRAHVSSLYRKLGVENRVSLAMLAREQGLRSAEERLAR